MALVRSGKIVGAAIGIFFGYLIAILHYLK